MHVRVNANSVNLFVHSMRAKDKSIGKRDDDKNSWKLMEKCARKLTHTFATISEDLFELIRYTCNGRMFACITVPYALRTNSSTGNCVCTCRRDIHAFKILLFIYWTCKTRLNKSSNHLSANALNTLKKTYRSVSGGAARQRRQDIEGDNR